MLDEHRPRSIGDFSPPEVLYRALDQLIRPLSGEEDLPWPIFTLLDFSNSPPDMRAHSVKTLPVNGLPIQELYGSAGHRGAFDHFAGIVRVLDFQSPRYLYMRHLLVFSHSGWEVEYRDLPAPGICQAADVARVPTSLRPARVEDIVLRRTSERPGRFADQALLPAARRPYMFSDGILGAQAAFGVEKGHEMLGRMIDPRRRVVAEDPYHPGHCAVGKISRDDSDDRNYRSRNKLNPIHAPRPAHPRSAHTERVRNCHMTECRGISTAAQQFAPLGSALPGDPGDASFLMPYSR